MSYIKSFRLTFKALLCFCIPIQSWGWGFFAHKQINRYAITTLPPGLFAFYKAHLVYLTEKAVNPDKRRYCVVGEAEKHFIDMEVYQSPDIINPEGMLLNEIEPRHLTKVHGALPWTIVRVHKQLTQAFIKKNVNQILKLSADLGHYVADAHVPLHTTQNYNGQLTGQEGIHALWETRLPLLFFDSYDLFVGQAHCIKKPLIHIWSIVTDSYKLVEQVLHLEKKIAYPSLLKYSFEKNGKTVQKQYSIEFATAYHKALQGQVEQQLRQSIVEVGNFWLTAWINAGAPNLDALQNHIPIDDEEAYTENILEGIRECPNH